MTNRKQMQLFTCRIRRHRNLSHGAIMVWTGFLVAAMMAFGGLAIDMGNLYDRRARAQQAADAAALAGDWALAHNYTDAQALTLAQSVASSNGYASTYVTCTPRPNGYSTEYTVNVSRTEKLYFGAFFNHGTTTISASATAWYPQYNNMQFNAQFYGNALGMPFCLCSYGPDQGQTRGDAIDARWTDIAGTFAKTNNPLNWNSLTSKNLDTGLNYLIQPVSNYATLNPFKNSKVMVQIYDPQTYVSSSDTSPLDQYVTTSGGGSSSPVTPNEKWRYTIYASNNTTGVVTQIATAVYAESADSNLEGKWVTPPNFIFDASVYPSSTYTLYLNVRTDDGSGNPGVGLDKNGYQLRAGPDYTNDATLKAVFTTDSSGDKIESPTNSLLPDSGSTSWNTKYGSLCPMGAQQNLSITAYNAGTGSIYLGYAGPNPNSGAPTIITINSWDDDSGASDVYYMCDAYPGVKFQGQLGYQATSGSGNGVWSQPGTQRTLANASTPSNTIYFAPGTYSGGNWTAYYTTGAQDVTTWNWTLNYGTGKAYPYPRLIYSTSYVW